MPDAGRHTKVLGRNRKTAELQQTPLVQPPASAGALTAIEPSTSAAARIHRFARLRAADSFGFGLISPPDSSA
jgi:hypothetical protein